MVKVKVVIGRERDGFYTAWCDDEPLFFGGGNTVEEAKADMMETIRITKEEIGKDHAMVWPSWLDGEYEFEYKSDVPFFLNYYLGIITPTGLGRLSGINPKQMWNYMHGVSKPRKKQLEKIQNGLHKLGKELMDITFL